MDVSNESKIGNDALFVDWLSVWQNHPSHSPINSGCITTTDTGGAIVFERYRASRLAGSHSTSCAVKSDGACVVFEGNFGRLNRADNLFNFDPLQTLQRANAAAQFAGLPPFLLRSERGYPTQPQGDVAPIGYAHQLMPARRALQDFVHLSRVDLTKNYQCGSVGAARSVIRSIQGKSVARVKKGVGGDASVWWSNTRYMLKVYIKSLEMEAHGVNSGKAYEYARDNGILRVELELKRRELHDLGWSDFDEFLKGWNMGTVHKLFADYEKILEVKGVTNDADFLDALPVRLRSTAALFLSGRDIRSVMSRASFFRYRRALLEYGIDISDDSPARIETVVKTVTVQAVSAPDWYWKAA